MFNILFALKISLHIRFHCPVLWVTATWIQGDQKIGQKSPKFLEKVAKTVTKPKIANIPTPKLNLKVQNIYVKPLLNPKNTCNKLQTTNKLLTNY
jgi:hypothetical protein